MALMNVHRSRQRKIVTMVIEIAATPPTTPPAIAPVFELRFTGGDGVGDKPRIAPGPSPGESKKVGMRSYRGSCSEVGCDYSAVEGKFGNIPRHQEEPAEEHGFEKRQDSETYMSITCQEQ